MTYVEFFDEVALDNIHACFSCVPDRVILIGYHMDVMSEHIDRYKKVLKERYKELFEQRGHGVEFIPKKIKPNSVDSARDVIKNILKEHKDCVFDVTGGDEASMMALGMVCANADTHIQVQKFNLQHDIVYDLDKDGYPSEHHTPMLSVEENVRIYGGDVIHGNIDSNYTYDWDLSDEFVQDIEDMWAICHKDVRLWNKQIGVFKVMNDLDKNAADPLTLTVPMTRLLHEMSRKNNAQIIKDEDIISALLEKGLLTCFVQYGDDVIVAFKNKQVKKCLTKEGQALEMKVLIAARSLQDEEGNPVYNDVMNGVFIDWDGQCHDEKKEGKFDVENEIDVLMMHRLIPVFISCKNGDVDSEEVYKLNTVAARFGGPYAKKVLIATALGDKRKKNAQRHNHKMDQQDESHNYLRQRARDMQIQLIEDIDEDFPQLLANAWKK